MMTTLLSLGAGWGLVTIALFWNLRGRRLLPSDDHVRVAAMLWPVLIPLGLGYLVYRACHFGAKEVVVDTVVSVRRVVDTYRHGTLLPARSSKGNSLRPADDVEVKAAQELETYLQETQ